MNLREYILEIEEERLELRKRVQELESQQQMTQDLSFKEPFYFGEGDDVPFCPKCWEADKTALHLVFVQEGMSECPSCGIVYYFKEDGSGSLAPQHLA